MVPPRACQDIMGNLNRAVIDTLASRPTAVLNGNTCYQARALEVRATPANDDAEGFVICIMLLACERHVVSLELITDDHLRTRRACLESYRYSPML